MYLLKKISFCAPVMRDYLPMVMVAFSQRKIIANIAISNETAVGHENASILKRESWPEPEMMVTLAHERASAMEGKMKGVRQLKH